MAGSANKRRAKEMKRLGWVWWPQDNSWVHLGYMDEPLFGIACKAGRWLASRNPGQPDVTFDCPIAAAIWISVECADEIAADKARQDAAWRDHCLRREVRRI